MQTDRHREINQILSRDCRFYLSMNGEELIFSQSHKRSENDNFTIFWEFPKTGHKPFREHLNLIGSRWPQ